MFTFSHITNTMSNVWTYKDNVQPRVTAQLKNWSWRQIIKTIWCIRPYWKITDLTNITPRHHIQHQIENERKQQGQIRHHGPGDTTLFHPSSPPFSLAPSSPTHSVHIYEPQKQGSINTQGTVHVCITGFNPLEAITWLHVNWRNVKSWISWL